MASLLLLLLLLLFTTFSLSSSRDTAQKQLISFKSLLQNPQVLQSWKPTANLCTSFTGVTCSSNGAITYLNLDSILLNADIRDVATYLLTIESLVKASLAHTNVTGSLSTVGNCGVELADLDLSGNNILGSVTDIPAMVRVCGSLRSLNLSGNQLGFFPKGSEENVGDLGSVEVLDLSFNSLYGGAPLKWIFEASFSGGGGGGGLKHLEWVGNKMSGKIPLVRNCSKLEYLDLSSNNITQVESFSDCRNLQFFNLSWNLISGEIPKDLFGTCDSLVHLDLSFNNISGNLPETFESCTTLETINLSNNNLTGELPVKVLTSLQNLKLLHFGYNRMIGSLPETLPSKLAELELLDLSSNAFNGSIPLGLCSKDSHLLRLKKLHLQNNLFTGVVPPSTSHCLMLESLDLSFNFLQGRIPGSIGELINLQNLVMWQNRFEGEIPPELGNLRLLQNLILDNNNLTGSIPDLSNCTHLNWISLSSNKLTGSIPSWIGKLSNLAILKMGNNLLSGEIPPEIGDCRSLVWLDLNTNLLNGTIPHTIAKQSGKINVGLVKGKKYVYLRNDGSRECHGSGNLLEFAGIRQEDLDRLPTRQSCNFTRVYMGSAQYTFNNNGSILFVDLSYNHLTGEIPREFGDIFYMFILNLGHNDLSGEIPPELGKLGILGILDLSHNVLSGHIPTSFSHMGMLTELDLSYNTLTGSIPQNGQLGTFPPYKYANNSGLCGSPLPPCSTKSSQASVHHRRHLSKAASLTMGLLFFVFIIIMVVIITVEIKRRRRRRDRKNRNGDGEDGDGIRDMYNESRWNSGVGNTGWKLMTTKEAMSISLAAFESENPLRKLTFADLLDATNGFHDDTLIGSGGFGDVYKAQLKDGTVVAIKKLIHLLSGQGDREFTAEMETIGKIKHRNLVPLFGYCKVGEERLLAYEYMKHGSLEDVLHNRKKTISAGGGGIKLDWTTRRRIAIGAARGLAFLHHSCLPRIIHRDMKSSNVLLDERLEARVSDFGMARLVSAMDTHLSVSTLAGTPGYVPPEYYQSFRCSTKGDVYSYGVVLLELLTGKPPTNSSDFGDNNLVGWVKQHSKTRISDVFDRELIEQDPSLELELLEHLKIACVCLDDRPLRRPTMVKVMSMFKEIQAGSTVDCSLSEPGIPMSSVHIDGVDDQLTECREDRESDG